MEEQAIFTAVRLAPSQRAKVEKWAELSGGNVSSVLRAMIDAVDLRTEPFFYVANREEFVQRKPIDTDQQASA